MEPTRVDDVIARRRLAGWTDPVLASEWRHLECWCTPGQLHALAQKGLEVDLAVSDR